MGHSTGDNKVVHYIARHGESRVAKAVLISAVPPLMCRPTPTPSGRPKSVFDDLQAQLAANRSEFYRALRSGHFDGFNRPVVRSSEAIIENWWRGHENDDAQERKTNSLPGRSGPPRPPPGEA